jgi:hypothetical protein
MREEPGFTRHRSRHFDRTPGPFLLVVVATVVAALPVDARACDPIGNLPHIVDMSMQATDHTPPTLAAIPAPVFHYEDENSNGIGGCGAKCGDGSWIGIPAVATDDMTAPERIGYRLSLESGTLPPNVGLLTMAQDPIFGFVRIYIREETTDFNFTLQVVAIDAAGNESAPQTVVVEHHDSGCSIAGTRISRPGLGWIMLGALIVTAYRRRRR